ncbi:MAG: hypothetical protein Kapaf2KO_13000 [Candidatus Kapaibacteriales bacterium]
MKLTDFLKGTLVAAMLFIGAYTSQSQGRIVLINQPLGVSACLGDSLSYLDILATFESQFQDDINYEWFKLRPDGSRMSIRYENGMQSMGADPDSPRLFFPKLTPDMGGEYVGVAWLDYNRNGMVDTYTDPNTMMVVDEWMDYVETDVTVVNVLTTPEILRESIMVYEDGDMDKEPVFMSNTSKTAFAEMGNTVVFDIDAHIFGIYEDTYTSNPTYDINIQWYSRRIEERTVGTQTVFDTTITMLTNDANYAGVNSDQLSAMVGDMSNINEFAWYATLMGECGMVQTSFFRIAEQANLTIDTQPMDMDICAGEEVKLNVAATVTGGFNETVSYQWMMGGTPIMDGNDYMGAMTNELTIMSSATVNNINDIYVMVTSSPSGLEMMSDMVDVTLKPDAVYTTDIDGMAVSKKVGESQTFTVAADNAVSYQWYKDGNMIAGETMPTLEFTSLETGDTGEYKAHAINECGTEVPSMSVALTVTTSIIASVPGLTDGKVTVSPNPTSNLINAEIGLEDFVRNGSFSLVSQTGNVIATKNFDNANGMANVSFDTQALGLASGNYFIVITIDGNSTAQKVVVSRD